MCAPSPQPVIGPKIRLECDRKRGKEGKDSRERGLAREGKPRMYATQL